MRFLPLFIVVPFVLLISAARGGEPCGDASGVPRDSVPELVRRLERDPLDRSSAPLRRRLFVWISTADLGSCTVDAIFIDDLQKQLEQREYPYREELFLQYMFGAASAAVAHSDSAIDCSAGVESGFRSMIAAYRNMVQIDRSLRDVLLDSLDGLRRTGRLGEYIRDRRHWGREE